METPININKEGEVTTSWDETRLESYQITQEFPKIIENNFSNTRKRLIVLLVALSAILTPLSSTIYFPSLDVVQEDLNTTKYLVDATISVYMAVLGVFPLLWGAISDRYGKRKVFMISQVLFSAGNIGCALVNNIDGLIILRVLQALGASAPIVTGVGTITDLYPREERGFALSLFFIGPLIGPIIGPIIGGFLNQYLGWRSCFWFLTIVGGVLLISSTFILPETLPKKSQQEFPIKITLFPFKISRGGKMFNPLHPLTFFKYPVVILASYCITVTFGSFFAVESSQSRVLADLYGLSSSEVGLTYLSLGFGTLSGNIIGGKIVDFKFKSFTANNPGKAPQPEIRLQVQWIGSLIITIGLLMFGWFLQFNMPLWATLIATFIVGVGTTFTTLSVSSYLVDIFSKYASSIAACYSFSQQIFSAIVTSVNTLMLEDLGYGGSMTLWAGLCFSVFLVYIVLMLGGQRIRERTGLIQNLKILNCMFV